jgi:protein TonB
MVSKGNVQYPYEAKRARLTGSGIARVSVSPDGSVTSVTMSKSTGHAVLDNAAVVGLRGARFKPGTVPQVNIPITFTMTGAQF